MTAKTPYPHHNFGDYLVFVDESGDHEMRRIDPQYPVFVLLFCIIRKTDYANQVCRDLQRFKFAYWGHDEVILHEHDIRKPKGDFLFLLQREPRSRFLAELTAQMRGLAADVLAVVIDKPALAARHASPASPYDLAIETGLDMLHRHLAENGQSSHLTPVIVERRGRREDGELELAFRRVCDGANASNEPFSFQLVMIPKTSNSSGLQITDLMARPVGIRHLRPHQPNQAFDIIFEKIRPGGLRVLP